MYRRQKQSITSPNGSPIASKQRPRKSTMSNILMKINRKSKQKQSKTNSNSRVVSNHKLSKSLSRSLNKSSSFEDDDQSRELLFSPKYQDTCSDQFNQNDPALKSPPISPKKGRQVLDEECKKCVRHIRQCVWNSVYDEVDGFLFMKYAPPLPMNYFSNRKPVLPPKKPGAPKYTLVLDLDETLVHCSIETHTKCDLVFPVNFNGDTYKVFMSKRPFFEQFLQTVSELFEVVIFTASQQCYADTLLDIVDPKKKYIDHRLFRAHCVNVEGNFVKDLRVLGRDLSKTVIIDNSPPAFTYQINNGIPIVSWYDQTDDEELKIMIPLLKKLLTLDDVRPAIKKYFQLKKLVKNVRA